jgi:hypothetical protein
MGITQQKPFAPVRPWRVKPLAKPVLSKVALSAFEKCREREDQLRLRNLKILIAGMAIIFAVLLVTPFAILFVLRWFTLMHPQNPDPINPPREFFTIFESAMLGVTFIITLRVAKKSRADVASQFLQSGNQMSGANDGAMARLLVALLLCGLLYGEFLVIDAGKMALMNYRLRNVDRHRAAIILAKLFVDPTGVDPRQLLQHHESPAHLQLTIAYLIVNEWADISPHGDRLILISNAKRALRRYDVYG